MIKFNLQKNTQIDAKTKLQEFSLKKYKLLPKYKIIRESGPQHNPIFKVEVSIPNSKTYSAIGSSKKDGQQNAAKKLLKNLKFKMNWEDEGYLLSKKNLEKMKILINVFTLKYGKISGIVYGGLSRKKKLPANN